jgi:polyisoprenoid-binding protein YceI
VPPSPLRCVAWTLLGLVLVGRPVQAEPRLLKLDPGATRIGFTLKATLHTVEGTAKLLRGAVRFDSAGGSAAGEIVADARSASTGLASRDARMHADVLESERFPTIVFRPEQLQISRRDEHTADVEVRGVMEIHGATHPVVLPATLSAKGDRLTIDSSFVVPYVAWGMKDPSSFLLRVAPEVTVQVHAEGTLGPP